MDMREKLYDKKEQILVLGALLHDIGKFVQRASTNFNKMKHEEFGYEFIGYEKKNGHLNITQNIKREVAALVRGHHRMPYNGSYADLLKILRNADHLSAKHDRDESEGVDEKISKTPLLSVYHYVNISGKKVGMYDEASKKMYYHVSGLPSIKSSEPQFPGDRTKKENNTNMYESLLNKFTYQLNTLTITSKDDINTLLYYLQIYTKYIPSAVYVSVPDIPLYDHLKTTAALALSMYRSKKEDKHSLLIMGDLSGIQSFIFSTFKEGGDSDVDRGATKRLRGRSFIVNLIIDSATKYIIEKLDLYEFNILWESGGNFLILAPNTEENKNKLSQLREDINRFLLERFGNVYLSISWVEWSGKEDFSNILSNLHSKIDKEKSKKYSEFMYNENFFVSNLSVPTGKHICPICGRNIVDDSKSICSDCEKISNIGKKLVKSKYLARCINKDFDCDFMFQYNDIKIGYFLADNKKRNDDEKEKYEKILEECEIFHIDAPEIPPKGKMRGFKLIKGYVPMIGENVATISELISPKENLEDRKEEGVNDRKIEKSIIGIFKSDVDCLGEIFAKGLKKKDRVTISVISELSFLMDLFFNIEVNYLARKHNIYVVFSGGDDLTVVGRYDEIVDFAIEFQNKFREWTTKNPDIHLSGAIVFVGEKFPLKRGVEIAESLLEKAKENCKAEKCVERGNRVAIFEKVLEWKDFEEQRNLSKKFFELQKNKDISSGFSHYLLHLHKLRASDGTPRKGQYVIPSHVPYLKYYFGRRGKKGIKVLNEELSPILSEETFKEIPVAVSLWVMERKYKGGD